MSNKLRKKSKGYDEFRKSMRENGSTIPDDYMKDLYDVLRFAGKQLDKMYVQNQRA